MTTDRVADPVVPRRHTSPPPGGLRGRSALLTRVATQCLQLDDRMARTLGSDTALTARSGLVAVVVLLVGGALMVVRLGASEIAGFNEGVEALVVQQMVDHGRLLFPLLNGQDVPFKPPLFHWTAAAVAYLAGISAAAEITARLPSVLFALAGIAMTMVFVRRRLGAHAAALSGLILLASYQYMSAARIARVDMALTFFETLTLLSFLGWLGDVTHDAPVPRSSRRRWHVLMGAAAGLAVLAKGPIGAILPLGTVAVMLAVSGRWRLARRLLAPGPVAVFLLLSGGWYAACLLGAQDTILRRQLVSENLARFTGGLGTMRSWYYLKPVLLNSAPLSLLVPVAVVAALKAASRAPRGESRDRDFPLLLAVFWIVSITFFSIAAYKRRVYLLPLWPAAAILLVWWLTGLAAGERGRALRGAVTALCAVLLAVNALYIPSGEAFTRGRGWARAAAADIQRVVPSGEPLYFLGGELDGDRAPLIFYLRRTVPVLQGTLDEAPPGYVLVARPRRSTRSTAPSAPREILTVRAGKQTLTLLRVSQDGS
jgi:4-amino-4-deoxy-L-arabinose transferase-like glycosyltransferase